MVIDGIADLIGAVNNEQESVELIEGSNLWKYAMAALAIPQKYFLDGTMKLGMLSFIPKKMNLK